MSRKYFHRINMSGFTLVELIVVITILVILGTIAFVNLGNFSGSARDGARISNLANLKKWLDLYQIKSGTYPMPEGKIDILSSGAVVIGYQGFARDQIAGLAKISPGGTIDPSDVTIYTTYSVDVNKTRMQAMIFLEDTSTPTAFTPSIVPTVSASSTSDYSKRIPRVTGDSLGILLGNSGSDIGKPVQEISSIIASGSLNIVTETGGLYKAYIASTNILSGTGPIFIPLLTNYDSTISTYPGCDTKDIKLPNGQIWAACNAGAITAWTNQVFSSAITPRDAVVNTWAGGLYQWGNNAEVSYTGSIAGQVTCTNTPNSFNIAAFRIWNSDWCTTQSNDLWGNTTNASIARQWPCLTGYHIPSQTEWSSAINTITTKTSWWISIDTIFLQNTLKLPITGFRNYSDGLVHSQSIDGYYWSSSSYPLNSVQSHDIRINLTTMYPADHDSRSFGFSVRCIKN